MWLDETSQDLLQFIGPGKVFDSSKHYVMLVDAIGNGVSSSPSNSREQPWMKFPRFAIRGTVEAEHRLLTAFPDKIRCPHQCQLCRRYSRGPRFGPGRDAFSVAPTSVYQQPRDQRQRVKKGHPRKDGALGACHGRSIL